MRGLRAKHRNRRFRGPLSPVEQFGHQLASMHSEYRAVAERNGLLREHLIYPRRAFQRYADNMAGNGRKWKNR